MLEQVLIQMQLTGDIAFLVQFELLFQFPLFVVLTVNQSVKFSGLQLFIQIQFERFDAMVFEKIFILRNAIFTEPFLGRTILFAFGKIFVTRQINTLG